MKGDFFMFDLKNLDRVVMVLYNYQQLTLKLQMNMEKGIGGNQSNAPNRVSNIFEYELTNKFSDSRMVPKLGASQLSFDFSLILETKREIKSQSGQTDFNASKVFLRTLDVPMVLTILQNARRWFVEDMGVFKRDGTGQIVSVDKKHSLSAHLYNGTQILLSPTIIADIESDLKYEGVAISTHQMNFAELTPMEFLGFVHMFETTANNIISSSLDLANFIILNHMYSDIQEIKNGRSS